jgi:hypothetical protein
MNLQYISDSMGKTTGVFIPINEWDELKKRYKGIDQDELDIPEWQKELVRQRADDYRKNPELVIEFDTAMDDIEKDL